MAKTKISFVILNWNGINDTLACLQSIKKQIYTNFEIIVVDNGSSKDQKDALRKRKDITFVDLPHNTGFTGGQIAAYKVAQGDYIALINSDSVIANDWCLKAKDIMDSDSDVAVVGGRAYSWNEDFKLEAFDESNDFFSYQVVNPKTGHCPTLKTGSTDVSVSSISGAAVLIRRSTIEKVGYFDDRFFAYYEESDLFARMKRSGYKVLYSPTLKVWHKVGQSTRGNPRFYLFYMHRNRFMFAVKNFDTKGLFAFITYYVFKEWLPAIWSIVRLGKRSDIEKRMLAKAGFWNLLHLVPTVLSRRRVQALGKTYTGLLKNDAQEDVTIVIPCYNYANYVVDAINSAVDQTYPPAVITIINDGSTDNSKDIIDTTVAKLSKTRVDIKFNVIHQSNSGIIATKNRGLELTETQWLIFLDADDIIDKNYIKKCFEKQKSTQADVVYTDMMLFGAVNYEQKVVEYNKYKLRSVNFIHNSALYRTNLLNRVSGYSPEFSIGFEDWELNIKLSRLNTLFSYLPEPLLKYRRHDGASRDNNAQQKIVTVVKMLESKYPDLYNLRYYWWIETSIMINSLKLIAKYPFALSKHTYYHAIMGLDRISHKNRLISLTLKNLRKIKKGKRG